jgi:hypothetical protein
MIVAVPHDHKRGIADCKTILSEHRQKNKNMQERAHCDKASMAVMTRLHVARNAHRKSCMAATGHGEGIAQTKQVSSPRRVPHWLQKLRSSKSGQKLRCASTHT